MNLSIDFKSITCCECSAVFALTETAHGRLVGSHAWFYCPHCSARQHFAGESEAEKFKRLYKSKNACCEDLREVVTMRERQFNGAKGAIGLIRKQRDEARDAIPTTAEEE